MQPRNSFYALLAVIAASLLAGYIVSVNTAPIQEFLNKIPSAAAYIIFILLYVVGTFIADLKDPLRVVSAVLYGAYLSSLLIYIAELVNLIVLFQIGRTMGQTYVEKKVPSKYQQLYRRLEGLSFIQILVLRLVPFVSYRVLDLGFGLTRISLKRYFFAGLIGSWPRILWIQLPLAAVGAMSPAGFADYFRNNPLLLWGYFLYTVLACAAVVFLYARLFKAQEKPEER